MEALNIRFTFVLICVLGTILFVSERSQASTWRCLKASVSPTVEQNMLHAREHSIEKRTDGTIHFVLQGVASDLAENQPKPPFKIAQRQFKPVSMIYILLKSLPVVYQNHGLTAPRLDLLAKA